MIIFAWKVSTIVIFKKSVGLSSFSVEIGLEVGAFP